MYPLFETIRYKNGIAENLALHQQRVDHTLVKLNASAPILLSERIASHLLKPNLDDKLYKCRVRYDLFGNVNIHFEHYAVKNIQSISLQDIGNNQYPYKFSDRNWINELVANAGTDEVIMTQNGSIKDASYANLVFFDGKNWVTPSQPLLMGTRRAALINAGTIIESPIHVKDLSNFGVLKLINAMMLWDECPAIQLDMIK
jgi:4-amino-4-deoxychorismate lyase